MDKIGVGGLQEHVGRQILHNGTWETVLHVKRDSDYQRSVSTDLNSPRWPDKYAPYYWETNSSVRFEVRDRPEPEQS